MYSWGYDSASQMSTDLPLVETIVNTPAESTVNTTRPT